jgi:hypothetical protein
MFSRFLALLVGLTSLVVLGLAFWPELVGLSRTWPWAGIVALRGSALVAALVLLGVLFFVSKLGRPVRALIRPLGFWLVIFIVATGWTLYDRGLGFENSATSAPPITGTDSAVTDSGVTGDITVLAWNTMGDKPAPLAMAQLALESNATVVVLPETSAETAHNVALIMAQAGTRMSEHVIAFDSEYIGLSTA